MSRYIRLCPACGQSNPEYEHTCGHCGQFIGLESPVAASEPAALTQAIAPLEPVASALAVTQCYEPCVLELPDGQRHSIQDGWIIGQAHPSSAAQVGLQGTGSQFVHRSHCRIQHNGSTWQVTALDQQTLGGLFTNPTVVNRTPLAPSQSHPLRDGDTLALSGLLLRLHIG